MLYCELRPGNIFENNGQTLIICMYGIHKACPKVFPFGEKRVAPYNSTRCEKLGSGNRVLETSISQIRKFPPSGVLRDAPYRALVQRLAEQCGPRRPDPRPGDGRALPALGLARPADHDIAKHRVAGPSRPGPARPGPARPGRARPGPKRDSMEIPLHLPWKNKPI